MNLQIITPDAELFSGEVDSVVVPGSDGLIGILNNHAPLVSSLKSGQVKINNAGDEKFFVEDGIVEFKNNSLSVLTSSIFNLKDADKDKIQNLIKIAEEEINKPEISDQAKYLADQKIEVLRSIN